MTKVLALDSATEACSVALIVDGDESSIFEVSPQAHTKLLLPMVDKVLKDKGMQLCDVDVLACGQGPGSFTGVRIGVSLAQGLAFGAEKKIVFVTLKQWLIEQWLKIILNIVFLLLMLEWEKFI